MAVAAGSSSFGPPSGPRTLPRSMPSSSARISAGAGGARTASVIPSTVGAGCDGFSQLLDRFPARDLLGLDRPETDVLREDGQHLIDPRGRRGEDRLSPYVVRELADVLGQASISQDQV